MLLYMIGPNIPLNTRKSGGALLMSYNTNAWPRARRDRINRMRKRSVVRLLTVFCMLLSKASHMNYLKKIAALLLAINLTVSPH